MQRLAGAILLGLLVLAAGCQAPTAAPSATSASAGPLADPPSDRLGWEGGYWHNESLAVTADDGLNESEREAVVSRAMARVEEIRGLEFERQVSVNVTTRAAFRNHTNASAASGRAEQTRAVDDAKAEALFLVGQDEDTTNESAKTLGRTVLGAYSSDREAIVLVSEDDRARIGSERTLAHELVHALQDQHFELEPNASTEDGHQGALGLIEGDAMVVESRYAERCGESWTCVNASAGGGSGAGAGNESGPGNMGLYLATIFPYVDGPGFVRSLHEEGGWEAVNAAYDRWPASSQQIIAPDRYPDDEPSTVSITTNPTGGWERVGDDPERIGQALTSTMLLYTLYDDVNETAVVEPRDALNFQPDGSVDSEDPLNYDLDATSGWEGDAFHVYRRGEDTATVWRSEWASEDDARAFASAYRSVVSHWGGGRVAPDRWTIEEGGFADAYAVRVDGTAVTVVEAPTSDDLDAFVPAGAG